MAIFSTPISKVTKFSKRILKGDCLYFVVNFEKDYFNISTKSQFSEPAKYLTYISTGYCEDQCRMVCASQVPPKISASLSSQGEAQQPTEKRGDDEDDFHFHYAS